MKQNNFVLIGFVVFEESAAHHIAKNYFNEKLCANKSFRTEIGRICGLDFRRRNGKKEAFAFPTPKSRRKHFSTSMPSNFVIFMWSFTFHLQSTVSRIKIIFKTNRKADEKLTELFITTLYIVLIKYIQVALIMPNYQIPARWRKVTLAKHVPFSRSRCVSFRLSMNFFSMSQGHALLFRKICASVLEIYLNCLPWTGVTIFYDEFKFFTNQPLICNWKSNLQYRRN